MTDSYDVAVVGGGLAGCSAAITLAQQGKRVVLFESKPYPHHKVCGEFLSPECADYLDELGVTPSLRALHPRPVHTVTVSTPDGTRWETHLSRPGMSISRYRLDQLLAERARSLGVELRAETTVTQVEGALANGFQLSTRSPSGNTSANARVVIAAHGKRSGLDRALERRFLQTPQPYTALKAHFYGSPLSGRVDLFSFPGGYCGIGEIEDGLTNVCLLVRTDVFQRAGNIETFVEWMQARNPQLGRWFLGARQASVRWQSISQVPFLPKPPVENDILMAGDAAGLITPLTGDGMSMALHGGQMAAQYVDAYLERKLSAPVLCEQYTSAWRGAFGKRLWIGRRLQSLMFQPRLLALGLHILNRTPTFGRFLVSQTRDVRYQVG